MLSTGHTGPTESTVTARIFREVLLVVLLGKVKLGRVDYLGSNNTITMLRQPPLVIIT